MSSEVFDSRLHRVWALFGDLPPEVQTRLETATVVGLDLWLKRLLGADTLEAIFARD
jgi:hypothetical protein